MGFFVLRKPPGGLNSASFGACFFSRYEKKVVLSINAAFCSARVVSSSSLGNLMEGEDAKTARRNLHS